MGLINKENKILEIAMKSERYAFNIVAKQHSRFYIAKVIL